MQPDTAEDVDDRETGDFVTGTEEVGALVNDDWEVGDRVNDDREVGDRVNDDREVGALVNDDRDARALDNDDRDVIDENFGGTETDVFVTDEDLVDNEGNFVVAVDAEVADVVDAFVDGLVRILSHSVLFLVLCEDIT